MFAFIYTAGPSEAQCLIIKLTMKYLTLSSVYSHIILRTYNYGVAYIISPSSSELNLFTLTFDLPLPEIFHRRKRGDKVICFPEITALHNRKLTEALKTAIKLQNKEKDDFFIHTLLGQPAALVVFYCLCAPRVLSWPCPLKKYVSTLLQLLLLLKVREV